MDREYERCIGDFQEPFAYYTSTFICVTAPIFTSVGLIGLLKAWEPVYLYFVIFLFGLLYSILIIVVTIYMIVSYFLRKRPTPRVRRQRVVSVV